MNIIEFKSHFFYTPEHANLNNAGQSLIPDVNLKRAMYWAERLSKEGALAAPSSWAETDVVRGKLAKFLGADGEELAYFVTTAAALSQAALGIPLQKDDEILTWDQEYPSNFYPWRMAAERSGAKVMLMPSTNWQTPVETILKHITAKTKVIAVSWVQFSTGAVTSLKQLSDALKGKDIWLVADVIQGVGARPFNFHESGFDIVCGGSHKWMASSFGAGFMLIKKERMLQLNPNSVGAMTYGDPDTVKSFTIQPKTTARRFEPGSMAMVEVNALGATLDLFNQIGIANIYKEASRLADQLREGIRASGFDLHCVEGPIVNFSSKDVEKMKSVETKFSSAKVAFAKRGPGIRLSPHAYNRDEEIQSAISCLK